MSNERIFEALASILLPGLGQMLQGRVWRGIGMLLLSVLLLPVLVGVIFWIWSIVDAYKLPEEV